MEFSPTPCKPKDLKYLCNYNCYQDSAKKIKNALNSWHVLSYQDTLILFHISIKSKSVYITDQTKLAISLLL